MAKELKIINIRSTVIKKVTIALSVIAVLLLLSIMIHRSRMAESPEETGAFPAENKDLKLENKTVRIGNKALQLENRTVQIENKALKLEYDPRKNIFRIENRSNGRVYLTEPVDICKTIHVKKTGSVKMEIAQKYNSDYGELALVIEITLEAERIKGVMKVAEDAALPMPIPFPGAFYGEEDRQFFAIPYAEGIYVPADEECVFGDFEMWAHKSTMPFTGMTDSNTGIMLVSDTPCDTAVAFVKPGLPDMENYLMRLEHYPAKGRFGYDRVFYIEIIENNGYNEMAKKYREHLENRQRNKKAGEPDILITLKEKSKNNRNVEKLIGAVDFWLGTQSMKSVAIIDDLTANGIRKALLNFQYGWVVYEDEKRPRVVNYAAEKGMLPGRYDNYSDIFDEEAGNISKRYRTEGFRERSIVKENGALQEGYSTYYKGQPVQGYRLNSKFSAEDVDSYLKNDLKENNYLGRFVDVAVSCRLYEDYSDIHPMLKKEDMLNRYNLLKKISSQYGMVTGTEETAWWAVPVSHYSEGTMTIAAAEGAGEDWSKPVDNPGRLYEDYTVNPSVRIPLKSLVYHDCHVSGWYTGDGISKVLEYWRTKELLTVLYGAMSLVFPRDEEFWEEYKDRFVQSIKVTGWVFEKTGYAKMESHEFISDDGLVQKTQFSNRIQIVVNFSDTAFHYGKTVIPAEDFIFIRGKRIYTSDEIAALHSQ